MQRHISDARLIGVVDLAITEGSILEAYAALHADGYVHIGNLRRLKELLRAADGIMIHQAAGAQPRLSRKPNRRSRRIGRERIGCVDVVVHIFLPETREFYDVDNLWEDADVTDIPDFE